MSKLMLPDFLISKSLLYTGINSKIEVFLAPGGRNGPGSRTSPFHIIFSPKKPLSTHSAQVLLKTPPPAGLQRSALITEQVKSLTVGGGAEYLSSVASQPFMPYVNAYLRVTSNLLLSGEYALGVRTKRHSLLEASFKPSARPELYAV